MLTIADGSSELGHACKELRSRRAEHERAVRKDRLDQGVKAASGPLRFALEKWVVL